MANALCALPDVKAEALVNDDSADALLTRYIGIATSSLQFITGLSFSQVSPSNEIWRYPDVLIGSDGWVRVRITTPRITSVTAFAVRTGSPAAAWQVIDPTMLDYDANPAHANTIIRAAAAIAPARPPYWARLSYTAGWVGDSTDPYPLDLQELVAWWAAYLYRIRDAPYEKTANVMVGTVTIPGRMPLRIKAILDCWTPPAVV